MASEVIVSSSETERVQKLGSYFRDYLANWFAGLVTGMEYSEPVSRELCLVLIEYAACALIASSDAAVTEKDDDTAARCKRAAAEAFAALEREILS